MSSSRLSDDDKESNDNDKGSDKVVLNEDENKNEDDMEALLSHDRELEDKKVIRSRISMLENDMKALLARTKVDYIEEQEEQERHDMLYNTKTIHMYAIAAAVNTDIHYALPWLFAITSLFLFVSLQSAALYLSTFETLLTSCSTHSDCRVGQYCEWNPENFYSATCLDCAAMYDDDWADVSQCPSIINDTETGEDIDQTVLWFDRSYKANFNISKYREQGGVEFWCLAWHHCEQTEMYQPNDEKDNICDYISLIANKFTHTRKSIYVIAIIILTFHLSQDIEEATVEEAILGHHLESTNKLKLKYLPAFLLRLSLRYRRNVLPWMVAIAVIGVSLADDLSVLNIMLNVLAILFILNADSTVAYLVLSPSRKKNEYSPKQLVKDANEAKIKFSFWGTRLTAAFPALFIVLSIFWIEEIVEYWNNIRGEPGCNGLHNHLYHVGVELGPLITGVIHSFCIICEEFLHLGSEWKKDIESFHEIFQCHIFWRNLKLSLFFIMQVVFELASNLFAVVFNAVLMDFVDLTVYKAGKDDSFRRAWKSNGILALGLFSVSLTLFICSMTRTQLRNRNRGMKDSGKSISDDCVC